MSPLTYPIASWPSFLSGALLVLIRVSALMVFAPIFSSAAISPRVKTAFVFAITVLIAPATALVPNSRPSLDMQALLGELSVGLIFGLSLTLLNEALVFAGWLLGVEFSFSLVNLMDPNSMIETPVLGQLLGWLGVLVLIGAGIDRTILAAFVRSFSVLPVGTAALSATSAATVAKLGGGIFLAGLQLAGPVVAAALAVDVSIALVSRLSPQIPAMVLGVPTKTMVAYTVLLGSLAVWPAWIERHFVALLNSAERLMVHA